MNEPTLTLSDVTHWRAAVVAAAGEIAMYSLAMPSAYVGEAIEGPDEDGLVGAHIPLLGGSEPLELALVGSTAACRALAAAMWQIGDDATPSQSETADAIGEIVNMLAGSVKRRMKTAGVDLELGLPIFTLGKIVPSAQQTILTMPVRFGEVDVFAQVIGPR
jgi:hypothetical protein